MVLNNLFPVFAIILLGRILHTTGFIKQAFLTTADRLVYYIFFPCMLFYKIGGNQGAQSLDLALPLAGLCALFLVFILSTLYIIYGGTTDFEAGTFSQSCYRFNTYIGMAIVMTALGEEGIIRFGLLIGVIIPIINILSVSILIWFSGKEYTVIQRVGKLLKEAVSNPLILACFAGFLFSRLDSGFPVFIDNTLKLISTVTLPLALISIGSAFTLKKLKGYLKLSMISAAFKLILFPLSGVLFMTLFGVTGMEFKAGLIFFCLPTATSIYILSSQMNSDTDLAAASIVFSTMASFISLSVALSLI
ncbi:hypothetical protein SAMN02746065_1042 [Desulfocicer vacuolatum DSM 3385]|uniref:AEC family transporter n=1 Tax=Desulfocicer vacuolatum DSM 3385 TaxID=1121400 RepID=A0A1W2A0Q8_9BACT|nr:AEC family transporter [Desulfocicer vacuolatum]SMC54196.1 hypothetical protein SAMN02746065_1042 [Desulfocicer vacuolatum DSM 3385]